VQRNGEKRIEVDGEGVVYPALRTTFERLSNPVVDQIHLRMILRRDRSAKVRPSAFNTRVRGMKLRNVDKLPGGRSIRSANHQAHGVTKRGESFALGIDQILDTTYGRGSGVVKDRDPPQRS
jgi:hypothetical protein